MSKVAHGEAKNGTRGFGWFSADRIVLSLQNLKTFKPQASNSSLNLADISLSHIMNYTYIYSLSCVHECRENRGGNPWTCVRVIQTFFFTFFKTIICIVWFLLSKWLPFSFQPFGDPTFISTVRSVYQCVENRCSEVRVQCGEWIWLQRRRPRPLSSLLSNFVRRQLKFYKYDFGILTSVSFHWYSF